MPTLVQERNKAIVQRWIDEVFNAGELNSVDDLKVSSYLDWTPLPAPYQQVDLPVSGIKDALPEWRFGLPDFEFSSDRMLAEGDFVACLGHWQAHHEGTYKGIAPTNRRLGGTRIDIFRVAGDKMVEHWGCGNELAFLQLVGGLDSHRDGEVDDTSEKVVREYIEHVLGKRDLVAVAEVVDPHAVDHSNHALRLLAIANRDPDRHVAPIEVGVEVDRLRVSDGKIVECLPALGKAEPVEPVGDEHEWSSLPTADNKLLVRNFLDTVLNGKGFERASAYFADGVTDHLAGSLTTAITLAAFPDFRLKVEHVIAEDDMVTVLATFTGTHERELMGLAPTGKGVTGRVAFGFRLANGRIAETWSEIEPWTLLQQLGSPAFA